MIIYFLKPYIKKRAKELHTNFPTNWKEILLKYKKFEKTTHKYILFTDFGYTPRTLNAGSMLPKTINLTKEWAAHIVLYNNIITYNAFKITLGHELTHKDGDFPNKLQYSKLDRKFINWINEVHADFGAIRKYCDMNRKNLISACEYKRQYKKYDKDRKTHPSWEKRKYYAKYFNFNSELITQIAKDVGCENNDLINQVCEYYQEIILENN